MRAIMEKIKRRGENYTIPQIDLSVEPKNTKEEFKYLYENVTVEKKGGYLGHPDSVLLKDGGILVFFPEGHGKGKTLSKISRDGGRSYTEEIKNPPKSWKNSRETPTVYRLEFSESDTPDKLIMISGNPIWGREKSRGGFDCSLSSDEGKTWSEYESFFTEKDEVTHYPIVALSSLTRLRENGKFVDKWMGLFHERDFVNYKTVLSFSKDGKMMWTKPEPYFSAYRDIEKRSQMCEVECVRSDMGRGDELMLITRSNSKRINSLLSFSRDEGKTWSRPVAAPASLNGERHKAEYLPDGRLFITFRSIERDLRKNLKHSENKLRGWYSEGWVALVADYNDLKNGGEGDYRIKVAHTYLDSQSEPCVAANADTGYCGNVILPDGTAVICSYGIFSAEKKKDGVYSTDKGRKKRRTYIISKRINVKDVEKLLGR